MTITMIVNTIPILLLILRLIRFFLRRKKVIMCLLRLEFILLNRFFLLIIILYSTKQPISHSMFMLVLGACEARLGLRLLINITRFQGNDLLKNTHSKF